MKRFYFLLTAFVMLSVSAWAQTYEDVTATYLTNANFASGPVTSVNVRGYGKDMQTGEVYGMQTVSGWSIVANGVTDSGYDNCAVAGAVFAYGSTNHLMGNDVGAPASAPVGGTGNALGFFAVWGNSGYYYQDVTLPAGSYTITYQIYNQSGAQAPATSYFGFLADNGTNYVVKPSELTTVGSWQTRKVKFTLSSSTTGKIAIGYKSDGGGSGANPHLFVDNVTIEYSYIGEDYTVKITNPSFEADATAQRNPTGWTSVGGNNDTGNQNADRFKTAGQDGDWLFNVWDGTINKDKPLQVSQSIVLPAGQYVLYAKIASDVGGHVTLFAGDQYSNVITPVGGDAFTDFPVYFTISDDNTSLNIGVRSEKSWFKCDDFRLFKLDDDTDLVPEHFETASGDWNVSGGTATLDTETPYYISKDDRYIVAQVSGVGTAIGDTKLTTLNSDAEGHYPTYTWTIGGDTYFVWDIEASRFSLWYTLGDNLSLDAANTQLNNNGTVFTFSGTPSITSIYTTKNITDDLATAKAYAELTELIAAAEELNTRLDEEATITSGIAAAKSVASNVSQSQAVYSNARSALLQAICQGLPNAGAEVEVTNIYIRNNSFETGWATPWMPKAEVTGNENTVKDKDMWGKDGNYVYNQKDGDNIAGSLVQNLSNLAEGEYTLEVAVVGADGKSITVKLGDNTTSYETADGDDSGHVVAVTGNVGNNASVQIGVTTTDTWFKADNFRLTYKPKTSVVDKTDLRRMILTAENLIKLGEGYSNELDGLITTYTELVNNTGATESQISAALTDLRGKIQSSYDLYNKDSRPTWSIPAEGNYFLYNVATKSYLNFGSQWGTRAIANDYRAEAGLLLTLAEKADANGDGGFSMSTQYIWNDTKHFLFAADRDGVWIDGEADHETAIDAESRRNLWAEMSWKFVEVPGLEGRGVYRLYRTSGDERVYGMTAGSRIKKVMTLDHMETEGDDIMISTLDADGVLNDLNSYWMLVSKDYRDGLLDAANLANPVNASYNIKNPDLEGFNNAQLATVWTRSTDNASKAVGSPNATSTWADCGVEVYNYAKTQLSQTITLPKAGLYRLRVNGFYRPGDWDRFEANAGRSGGFNPASNYAAIRQHKGEVEMNAYLYASDQQVPLMSINTGDKGTVLPFGTATDDKQNVGGFFNDALFKDRDYDIWYFNYGHVPNSPAAGADRFREDNGEGRYSDNSLLVYVPEGDLTLTIGVKKDGMFTNDWALYDHFNIWYLGNNGSTEEQTTFAKAYNDYRKARIDAINVLFDTYHYTELRDTAYTRYLNENGFDLTTKYGSPVNYATGDVDVWNEGDPKGTKVFALWLKDQLANDDALVAGLMTGDMSSEKAAQLKTVAEDLDYDVAVAKLAYQMAEFYFFSRGVQQFYEVASDGSSQMIADGNKSEVIDPLKESVNQLKDIDLKVLNTLKQAMEVESVDNTYVMGKEAITELTESLTTHYADPSTLKMDNVTPSTNSVKDPIKEKAVAAARVLTPPTRAEFDLTFMLPRADVIGLEQWDWLPVFEWLSDDDPSVAQYNYDVHSYNNTYKEHTGYFAERWRSDNGTVGLDENTWAIYQNLKLPVGLYRFSAAAFARNGGAKKPDPAENAYIAMNLVNADAENVMKEATLIPTVKLDDISTFYEIVSGNVDEENLADVNVGMYIGSHTGALASWIGMSQMRLYKIPEVTISEDKVYRVGLNADGHGNGYDDADPNDNEKNYYPESKNSEHAAEVAENPYLFNISPAARITGVKRTFKAGTWQTLTLPFDMSRQEFLDMLKIKDVVINQFTGSRVRHYEDWSVSHPDDKLGARVDLYFERETGDKKDSIYAHRPCLVWIPKDAGLETPTWEVGTWYKPGSVEIVRAKEASYWPDKADFQRYSGDDGVYLAEFSFDACYAGVNVGEKYVDGNLTTTNDGLGSYLPETSYYISGNEFKYVPRKDKWSEFFGDKPYNPVRSKGLRGYFTYHGDSEAVQQGKIGVWSYEFDTGNGTDKIELNNFGEVIGRQINGRDVTGVYNINGQLLRKDGSSLEGLSKGVYIVNGNKVIIK